MGHTDLGILPDIILSCCKRSLDPYDKADFGQVT